MNHVKRKAVASEMILTIGVLIAAGIALIQIKSVFYSEEKLSQQDLVNQFARDIESVIDKSSSVTGNATFSYKPQIKKYKLEVKDHIITVEDRISGKSTKFTKFHTNIKNTIVQDSLIIYISKIGNDVFIFGRCLEIGEECSGSYLCCDKNPCWGDDIFVCQQECAEIGQKAADDASCCSGYVNKTTGLCDEPPYCPKDRLCPGAPETKIIGGEDCCPTELPSCSGGHCCSENKPYWCHSPEQGDARCMDENEYEELCSKICPQTISVCYNHWHWENYGTAHFQMNIGGKACDYYETCHYPVVQPIVEEIISCCDNKCSGNCHSLCNKAVSDSGLSSTDTLETRKKCYGLYSIYGLGPAAKWMKGYLKRLEEPSSVMFEGGTWMCTGYSIQVTTLLRSVGYSNNEVYSVIGPEHAYNLVKFPGESQYRFVDTVGNNLYISGITSRDGYREQLGYCRTSFELPCQNDEYYSSCPSKSNIILGASC